MFKINLVKMTSIFTLALCAIITSLSANAAGLKPTEITVAYIQQWPTPNRFAQAKMIFDEALGLKVNWVALADGTEMTAAMASGKVQIAYAQGKLPFLAGISGGNDLSMVAIAASYPENDNCILRDDADITRDNAVQLAGRKIAIQVGSITHYRLLKILDHLGVDQSEVEIVAMPDAAASAYALEHGYVVMACASGSALRGMYKSGKPLMTGAELEAIGLKLFDIVTVPTKFATEHPEIVQAFVDVTEASNKHWVKNPGSMQAVIARAAGLSLEDSNRVLQNLDFPPAEEQKSIAWMAGLVPAYIKDLAEFFVEQGQLENSLNSYDRFITTRFLR
ncbi:MAG: ABC transporter substrate-binding protein [Gammaproteobacteria bacterium]|nr:ABC transporter substrate-binding protein [Gammaproteobacteria bacterium]